jgi:hypothetical protein
MLRPGLCLSSPRSSRSQLADLARSVETASDEVDFEVEKRAFIAKRIAGIRAVPAERLAFPGVRLVAERLRTFVETLDIDTYWPGIQASVLKDARPCRTRRALSARCAPKAFRINAVRPQGYEQYSAILYLDPSPSGTSAPSILNIFPKRAACSHDRGEDAVSPVRLGLGPLCRRRPRRPARFSHVPAPLFADMPATTVAERGPPCGASCTAPSASGTS